MIPHDFAYHRPERLDQALPLWQSLAGQGQSPFWLSGGTEIITMARTRTIQPSAVIDIKRIPEARVHERAGGQIRFGAALTLREITEANHWPLLSQAAGRVADFTARCKITLGGNIAGQIPYREAVLPFLLADARALVATGGGLQERPLAELFHQELRLRPGEFLVQLMVDEAVAALPHMHVKRTRLDWVAYPLLTVSALQISGQVRFAFAGLCGFPFRSTALEGALNQAGRPMQERLRQALTHLPAPIISDQHGSAEYRTFVWQNTVRDIYLALGG